MSYVNEVAMECLSSTSMSPIIVKNSSGPSTDPCGIPLGTLLGFERIMMGFFFLFRRNFAGIQLFYKNGEAG